MKTFKQILSEVARAQSPADKEFVALHPVDKKQFVRYPESQFKATTKKDESKMAHPSNETGVEDEIKKEKPLGEEVEELEEAVQTGNPGYGYHGEAALKHGSEGADKHYSKMHSKVKKLAHEAGHLRDAKHPNKMVKHYLDSRHGRHLAGHEDDHEYIKKDFGGFKKTYKPEHFEEQVTVLEGADSLMELSKKTLGSYIKKASADAQKYSMDAGHYNERGQYTKTALVGKRIAKRNKGVEKATDKLVKEGKSYLQLFDELNEARFDHRAAAEHGIVHFDVAKQHADLKKGSEVDFYKHDTSKTSGVVHAYDGKTITYKEHGEDGKIGAGKTHKFKTGRSYPGHTD